jgi:hypothetical protein
MITHSEIIQGLSTDLKIARAEMTTVIKNSDNPFFKSKYADLNSFIDSSNDALLRHSIVLTQHPFTEFHAGDAQTPPTILVGCETMLLHAPTGEWLKSRLLLPCDKLDAQKAGSAITYARRYSLQAILNLPAYDDDAEMASHKPAKQQPAKQQPAPTPPPVSMDDNLDYGDEVLPSTSKADCLGMIGKARNVATLNQIYKSHIEGSTVLSKQDTAELIAKATERKQELGG